MSRNIFVVHHCKNTRLSEKHVDYCNNCFIDRDLTNVKTHPPTWKYCPECVAKGFKNPKTRKETMPEEVLEALSRGREVHAKKREEAANDR